MLEQAEHELAELVVREQRGFRRILFGGMGILVLLVLMSAALGVYYFYVSKNLEAVSENLQRQAFETRRRVDAQNNRISDQELAIKRAYADIRRAAGGASDAVVKPEQIAAAREGVQGYLRRGRRISLADERVLGYLSREHAAAPDGALAAGVLNLAEFVGSGEAFPESGLPQRLQQALTQFESASADTETRPAALAGVAWVRFLTAAARNYAAEPCNDVFASVAAATEAGGRSPQPLYWRAQCERKLGRTQDALIHYAEALDAAEPSALQPSGVDPDDAEIAIAMNAFHGVGTTLVSGQGLSESTREVAAAMAIATTKCPVGADTEARSPRMRLALGCLGQAIRLRGALRQTPNQISGSAENLSFAHLRDGDYVAAFRNTQNVERTGLFAWNELTRALTARHVLQSDTDDDDLRDAAGRARAEARRNVSFFTLAQFNACELRTLLGDADFAEARDILLETHPRQSIDCAA